MMNCLKHGLNTQDECKWCGTAETVVDYGVTVLGDESPLMSQVGGDHYKSKAIQPVQYCMANGIGFMEGSVIKYVSRWRDKGGVQDLEKAKHFLELLIEYEKGR